MKQIILLYVLALFACFSFGLICSLIACYSWWYAFLLCFIASFGWIPYATISQKITPGNINRVAGFLMIAFIVLVIILLFLLTYAKGVTFWMITVLVAMISAILSSGMLLFRIRVKLLTYRGLL